MCINFPPPVIIYYTFLGQKCSIDFSPDFSHFFTDRSTSESYIDPLKVISVGSMVEYLPIGSQGAPKIIIGKKYFRPLKTLKSLTPYLSPLCPVESEDQMVRFLETVPRGGVPKNKQSTQY